MSAASQINQDAELRRAGAFATGWWGNARFLIARYPLGAAGFVILVLFVLAALFAGYVAPMDPLSTNAKSSLAPPGAKHWLGAEDRKSVV